MKIFKVKYILEQRNSYKCKKVLYFMKKRKLEYIALKVEEGKFFVGISNGKNTTHYKLKYGCIIELDEEIGEKIIREELLQRYQSAKDKENRNIPLKRILKSYKIN